MGQGAAAQVAPAGAGGAGGAGAPALGAVPDTVLPKDADAGERKFAASGIDTLNRLGDRPDFKAAANGVPVESLGAVNGKPMTKPQVIEGAKVFARSYIDNGAKVVIAEYIRHGKIKEAQEFEKWIRDGKTQEGLEAFSKAAFLSTIGDVSGSLDALADAYNTVGYFDDGYQIDKEKSEIMKDKAGNPSGIKVVFRNQRTGEETSRVMDSADFAEQAKMALEPTAAFDAHMEASVAMQRQMQEQLLKADEERRKAGIDLVKSNYDAVNKAATEIYKNSIGLDGKPTMTFDEALAEAQAAYGGAAGGDVPAADDVPVLRRSQ